MNKQNRNRLIIQRTNKATQAPRLLAFLTRIVRQRKLLLLSFITEEEIETLITVVWLVHRLCGGLWGKSIPAKR